MKDALGVNSVPGGPSMEEVINAQYAAAEKKKEMEETRRQEKEKKEAEAKREKEKEKSRSKAKADIWSELAAPKDKWKVGRTLLELEKQFPMDEIVRRMAKEEFKSNKVFRYPEEYEVYEEEEEAKRKLKKAKTVKRLDPTERDAAEIAAKEKKKRMVEELKKRTITETAEERDKRMRLAKDKQPLAAHLREAIKRYFKDKEKRLEEHTGTLRNYIGEQYVALAERYPEEMKRIFPFPNYGAASDTGSQALGGTTVKRRKLYPKEFKAYFLDILRGYVQTRKGKYEKVPKKNIPFWIPSSKPCPARDKGLTLGESTAKSSNVKGRKKEPGVGIKDIQEFCLHAWNRKDEATMEKRRQILMSLSDAENCTFKPHVTPYYGGGIMPKREEEIDPAEVAKGMGKNFEKSYPYVFKSGVYNKAVTFFQKGAYVDAMNKLREGFNIESLKRNFHPNFELYKKYEYLRLPRT
ncbi:MAG: hypothetical protein P4L67_04165 [Candidatus Pacebacteria bacterium]|nr:hypothetical protein [Candidatus Paceibacterota bacterium]